MQKHEWRKKEKDIYIPKTKPELIYVPNQKFITIDGKGNPNDKPFADKVGALYSLAYSIKMMPKRGVTPEGYFDYTVFPLEGLWDLDIEPEDLSSINKDDLIYTIMIRQPEFVTDDVFKIALEFTKKKKPSSLLDEISFDVIEDGLSVQLMHIGSYDDEPTSFRKMSDFIKDNKLIRNKTQHREIYLSDPRKADPLKMKTVLRFSVTEEIKFK
ncbi:MAG: GyrI-like domain-containing protein [Clostridioides difficile]|nr:GyrI-like domain-containing protein [Clostridioides difficile]